MPFISLLMLSSACFAAFCARSINQLHVVKKITGFLLHLITMSKNFNAAPAYWSGNNILFQFI